MTTFAFSSVLILLLLYSKYKPNTDSLQSHPAWLCPGPRAIVVSVCECVCECVSVCNLLLVMKDLLTSDSLSLAPPHTEHSLPDGALIEKFVH